MNEVLKAIQELKNEIKNDIKELRNEMNEKFNKVDERFNQVDIKLDTIAITSNDDVITLLKRIEKNTKDLNTDVEFLSKKVGNHERIIDRLNNN